MTPPRTHISVSNQCFSLGFDWGPISVPIHSCHTFRATGVTAYLKNNGLLEHAQTIANHSSPRTTKLYDRRSDEISLDEVEKISI